MTPLSRRTETLWQPSLTLCVCMSLSLLCCVGAHLNPAVSLSFCVLRKVSWSRLLPYSLSQVLGAYLASGLVYLVYYGWLVVNIDKYMGLF